MQAPNPITSLISLIGLSNTDCPCANSAPEGANLSESGYFLAGQDGIPMSFANAAADCENGGVWDILAQSRLSGAKQFWADINKELGQNFAPMYPSFKGYIGKVEESTAINSTKRRAVFRLKSTKLPAVLKIKGFQITSTASDTITVEMYESTNLDTAIWSEEVDLIGGRWTAKALETPYIISLDDREMLEGREYYITWELPDGVYYRRNRMVCCNRNDPQWRDFVKQSAYLVDNLEDIENGTAQSCGDVGLGMVLHVETGCTFAHSFSDMSFDVADMGSWSWFVANGVLMASIVSLCNAVLNSPNINFYTVYSAVGVERAKEEAQKKYDEILKHLKTKLPEGANKCFVCGSTKLNVEPIIV